MDLARPRGFIPQLVLGVGLALAPACTWFNDDPFADEVLRKDLPVPEQIDAKLGRFERCRASLNPVLEESWTRYQAVVGRRGNISPRDRYFGIERARFRTCSVAIADGLAMEPVMPELESAAKAVRDIASEFAERTRWHGRQEDEGVIEEDQRLARAYERWQEADTLLVTILDRTREVNDPKLLELLEERGEEMPLRTRAIIVQARPLVRCLGDENANVREACDPYWEGFDSSYSAFIDAVKQQRGDSIFWIDTFTKDAHAFHEVAQEALSRLSSRGLPRTEREQLQRTYQDLLRDAETLRFGIE